MKKKIVAIALSALMAFSVIPTSFFSMASTSAFATEIVENPTEPTQTKEPRKTALDLTTQVTTDMIAEEGWAWNADTKTLTLDGLEIETDATPAVTVPAGTTVILADGSQNSITTTASSGRGIECAGSMTIKTADNYTTKGILNITTGTSGRGIIYRPASPVPTAANVALDFSNIVLNITDAQRAIESTFDVTVTDETDSNTLSVEMTGTGFTHNGSSADRGIQVYNKKGYAKVTVENSTIETEGFVYSYGYSQSLMTIENSNITAKKIKLGWWNTHTDSAQLYVDNSTLVMKNLNGSDAAIEVGVNAAVTSVATLKNSRIIAVNNRDAAISVSRSMTAEEKAEYENEAAWTAAARGTLTIENCEMFLSDRDKAGLTHLSLATIEDSDITTVTAPADTTVTVNVENNNFNLTLPAGTVIKSGGETYTTIAETALTLDTDTQILSVPANTTLTTADGDITTESVMTIAPGQVLSASETVKIYANITTAATEIVVGEKIFVSVNVSADGSFNASQLKIRYPADCFTFSQGDSTLNGATVTVENGVLKLVDYGAEQNYGDGIYVLAFTATQSGDAGFALVSAGFGTLESADENDLTKADCNVISTTVTVKNNVTLSNIFGGKTSVYRGDNYTFGIEENTGAYYNYTNVSATMGGSSVSVTDNGDGTWTVENVTGELVIDGTRTPKTHKVVIEGKNNANDGETATYATDYTFTLADDIAAGLDVGYIYAVESITINGKPYTSYSLNNRVCTIVGTDIIGDVVITISATEVPPNKFSVAMTGNGTGAAKLSASVVDIGGGVTLTITPEVGYVYTVTAGGYEIAAEGNDYSVANVTTGVAFEVMRAVDVSSATVTEYVTLNGSKMWLVQIGANNKIDGKVYTYTPDGQENAQAMFWSDEYKAYVTVVVSSEQPAILSENFAITTGTATVLISNMDVNMSGSVDANDAQLVWNMYNVGYENFTDKVTVEKFLRADVNGDKVVNMNDAAAIVAYILA